MLSRLGLPKALTVSSPQLNPSAIAVENTQTLERYRRNINQEYISHQDASFQRIFGEAKHIYDYLKAVIN
jgi:hypothetical protein